MPIEKPKNTAKNCFKTLVLIFNGILLLLSLAIFAFGVLSKTLWIKYYKIFPGILCHLPLMIMILGAAIFFIGIIGLVGAIIESRCFLIAYSVLVTLLILFVIGVAITMGIKKDEILASMKTHVFKMIHEKHEAIQVIEKTFHCCGVSGPNEYLHKYGDLPRSCCGLNKGYCKLQEAYKMGCLDHLSNLGIREVGLTIGFSMGIVLLQVLCILFALQMQLYICNDNSNPKHNKDHYRDETVEDYDH